MSDSPESQLETLGISYVIGALFRHDTRVITEDGKYGLEVAVPAQAVPDIPPGTTADAILRFKISQ